MMNKLKIVVALFSVFLVTNLSLAQATNSAKIFRYITLGKYGKLHLGKSFETKDQLSIKLNEKSYKLKKGIFGGARSIIVHLNDSGLIETIEFYYKPGKSFDETVKFYSKFLGKPSKYKYTESLKRAVWDDGSTRFEYIQEKAISYSILLNKSP